jgi:hypothetical protein
MRPQGRQQFLGDLSNPLLLLAVKPKKLFKLIPLSCKLVFSAATSLLFRLVVTYGGKLRIRMLACCYAPAKCLVSLEILRFRYQITNLNRF